MTGEVFADDGACWLALDPTAGRPLRRAAEDLAALWEATERPAPHLETMVPAEPPKPAQHLVVLGAEAGWQVTRHLFPAPLIPPANPEGFVVVTYGPTGGWRSVTRVVGRTEAGIVAGVRYLLRQLITGEVSPFPTGLAVTRAPHFPLRGMYAHTAWLYHHPYALRTWSVSDWQSYVDLLATLNLNLLMIWIPVGMLPLPISDEDARWLARFREVVDYAHQEHGMVVLVGECANNLLEERPAEPIEEREYFRYCASRTVNPGDPAVRARLIENRSLLYRAVGNADGYWIIDGDPGGWDGSPAEEFVTLFRENVAAIARWSDPSPTPRPLYYWLWRGWGIESQEANYRHILQGLTQALPPEAWGVLACQPKSLVLAQELGLASRTVYFPYGALEREPSLPLIRITPETVSAGARASVQVADLLGVMGNTQTPLVQLAHHYLWADAVWNPRDAPPLRASLTGLGRALFPAHAALLGEAWSLLAAEPVLPAATAPPEERADKPGLTDQRLAAACRQVAARLRQQLEAGTLGPAGPVARALIPHAQHHLRDLVTMLELRESAAWLSAALTQHEHAGVIRDLVLRCAYGHVAWQQRHGYVRGRATTQRMQGSGVSLVTGGTYHPGKGTYGPYIDDVLRAWTQYQQALPEQAALIRLQVRAAVTTAPKDEQERLSGWIEEVVEGKGIR